MKSIKYNNQSASGGSAISFQLSAISAFLSCILHRVFKRYTLHVIHCTLFLLAFLPFLPLQILPLQTASAAEMKDYCVVPPYVTRQGIMPNITIVYEKGSEIVKGAYYNSPYDPNRTYYGFFKSTANYTYNTSQQYFEQPSPTCTPTGTNNCFSGNLLNWAFMSSLDLSRKALIGFGWDDTLPGAPPAGDAFTYSGNFCKTWSGSTCTSQTLPPISYIDLEDGNKCVNANVTIAGTKYSIAFTVKQTGGNPAKLQTIGYKIGFTDGAPTCSGTYTNIVNVGGSGGNLAMKFTDETRTGLIQKYADKDSNYQYDMDQPRFGVKRWNSGAAQQEDIIRDSPSLSAADRATFFRNLISAISKSPGADPTPAHLGDMMKEIVNYYKGSSSSYEDNDSLSQTPYNWADDPMKACRRTYALFVTTGTYLGQDANKLSPLPAPACSSLTYTDAFTTNTCFAYNTDLYTTDGTPPKQNISTYVVHTTFYGAGAANEARLAYAAKISDGEYLKVDDPNKFEEVLEQAILDMLKRAASGTAASVLASGEGSGANLIQAVFYPRTPKIPLGQFSSRVGWLGRLSNYWYYVDPLFSSSTILEDTTDDDILNLSGDYRVTLRYDLTNEYAVGDRYPFGSTTLVDSIRLEYLKNLWDAGVQLWERSASSRTIYIPSSVIGTSPASKLDLFSTDNASFIKPYLDVPTDNAASIVIRYVRGEDFPNQDFPNLKLRPRTVAVDLNGDNDTNDTVNGISESAKVWKLGDVLNSTPRISSWIPLNTYDKVYSDTTYSDFLESSNYKNRGMVFAGANDGMLHAFKLGKLELSWTGQTPSQKARLTNPDATPLGYEKWAFIPKNVLPYLKYLADPGYCHIYSVDLAPYLFDASINGNPDDTRTVNSWRTILIGGMRFGGACKPKNVNCATDTPNSVCAPAEVGGSSIGFSSYFALDVTDQNNPQLLWEFSHPQLGFATTGPAIVRISAKKADGVTPDNAKNGYWFVVFGSGPTGPIDVTAQQFLGRSDQNLRLFILDLKTGTQATPAPIDTGVQFAFAGSMLNVTIDPDLDYQDDVVYVPYVKRAGDGTWTQGGIGRLLTKEDPIPTNWAWSAVMDNIGPVTSAVANLQNKRKGALWLYFGTGRYFFEKGSDTDDGTGRRRLFGIKEPCFSSSGFDHTCTTSVSDTDLRNVTNISNVPSGSTADSADFKGWYINLDSSGSYKYSEGDRDVMRNYWAERVITDPLSTATGLVFFTTYKPYSDICAYGGKSFIWALRYNTGGAPGALLKGMALLQVSTGAIEQIDLSKAFTEAGGRKTSALEGVPPTAQGLSIMSTPPPVKRTIHIRER